jgi:hypothetical protein
LREKRRLRVFENRVLMRIFEPKSDEVTGEWRKQYNVLVKPGVNGWVILRWMFRKWNKRAWTGSMCLRIGTVGCLL